MRKAFFIGVGSELINFKPNQYSVLFSQKLKGIGVELNGEITAKDDFKNIENSINFATKNSDIIIITGGLGPTFDDLTRQVLSKILKTPLVYSKKIESFLKKRYRLKELVKNFKNQCLVLKDALLIENYHGTAFGEIVKKDKKIYIILPGPRREWEPMWKKVTKYIKQNIKLEKIYFKRIKIADLKEVEIENKISDIIERYKNNINITILAGPNICELYIESRDKKLYDKVFKEIKDRIKDNIYGYDDENLEGIVSKILKKRKITISTAESCTCGLLSTKLTDMAASSVYYIGGINAYSNFIKEKILKVNKKIIEHYGAVSEECAQEMAKNIKKIFETDYSLSITGIAGPGGGSKEKPVGLVYFGISTPKKTYTEKRIFKGERKFIRQCATNTSLWLLLKHINKEEK